MEEINWDTLLLEVDLSNFGDILDNELEQVTKPLPQPCSIQNSDEESTVSSWIEEIEKLRNRDATVRSRERKKMYVKDLDMKS
ncbi:hypothetical protein Gotur_029107, partial [Gossypium turneri]